MTSIEIFADNFFNAFYEKVWLGGDCPPVNQISISDAYKVQDLVAQKRIGIGEEVAGFKVGCTSKAIRSQFGLSEPIYGRLFQPHIFQENVELDWRNFVNCAIEPEMVIKIGTELTGIDLSDEKILEAIEYVSPGIEIHNLKFWYSPPSLQELICSGGIHAGLVIGDDKVSPRDLQFKDEVFHVYKDDKLVTLAPATEIMGGPLNSLRWLVGNLTSKGKSLKSGSLVIPGSPVKLVSIDRNTELKVMIENVGSLIAFFEGQKLNKKMK